MDLVKCIVLAGEWIVVVIDIVVGLRIEGKIN